MAWVLVKKGGSGYVDGDYCEFLVERKADLETLPECSPGSAAKLAWPEFYVTKTIDGRWIGNIPDGDFTF